MKFANFESDSRNQPILERRKYGRRSTDNETQDFRSLLLPFERLGRHVLLLDTKQMILYQSCKVSEWITHYQLPLRLQPHFYLSTPKHARQFQAFLESVKATRRQDAQARPSESCNLLLSSPNETQLRLSCFAYHPPQNEDTKILVLLSNPGYISESQWQTFRRLYQLTGAELRLTSSLAVGLSLEAYSQKYGVSIHTARSQLKSVFAKTETRRQTDLVRLVFLTTSP